MNKNTKPTAVSDTQTGKRTCENKLADQLSTQDSIPASSSKSESQHAGHVKSSKVTGNLLDPSLIYYSPESVMKLSKRSTAAKEKSKIFKRESKKTQPPDENPIVAPSPGSSGRESPASHDSDEFKPQLSIRRRSSFRAPAIAVCYICGRKYDILAIRLHEPQCLERWRAENRLLPSHLQKPEPKKDRSVRPVSAGKGRFMTNKLDMDDGSAWGSSSEQLLPCDVCGRVYQLDRLLVHQRTCKGR